MALSKVSMPVLGATALVGSTAFVTLPGAQEGRSSALRGAAHVAPQTQPSTSTLCVLPAVAAAGATAFGGMASTLSRRRQASSIPCSFSKEDQIGAQAPLGFFDPLDLCKDEATFKDFRAKEIKHGRLAMMGALGMLTQSLVQLPGFEGVPKDVSACTVGNGQVGFILTLAIIAGLEAAVFVQDESKEPGNFGNPVPWFDDYSDEMRAREINNGRIAMFAAIGQIAAGLYTGQSGIEQLGLSANKNDIMSKSLPQGTLAGTSSQSNGVRVSNMACRFSKEEQIGAQAPLGFFDPLDLCKDEATFKDFRAKEIKHGRLAMMGALGMLTQSLVQLPGFEGVPKDVSACTVGNGQVGFILTLAIIAGLEAAVFVQDESKEPGNFGNPVPWFDDYSDEMRAREINNGRIAMFAAIGQIAAGLYTGQSGIEQLGLSAHKHDIMSKSPLQGTLAGTPSQSNGMRVSNMGCRFSKEDQIGAQAPLGFFDPLDLCKDEATFKDFRAKEIKHGRLAMMGALGMLTQSLVQLPGFEGVPKDVSACTVGNGQVGFVLTLAIIAGLEAAVFVQDESKEPGNFGNPVPWFDDYSDEMRAREINNGRIAMFAAIGQIAAGLYTGKAGIEQFGL